MERPLTEVQKFIKETQRQIDEEGLLGMSGTNFDKGDPIRRVLKAKQFEYRAYSGGMKTGKGKFASVALIAKDLNAMNKAIQEGNVEPFSFNDSQIGSDDDNPTLGCDGCCDYDVCWPNEEAIEQSRKARKIIRESIAKNG